MKDGQRFVHYYDLDQGDFDQDVDFYLSLAQRTGSPVLELGAGTGRLLLLLARAGYRVTGIERLPDMLARAERKIQAAGEIGQRIRLVQGDFGQLDLDERFKLALLAVNTMMHVETAAEQAQLLERVFAHLEPGGCLALDLFHPHPETLAPAEGQLLLEKILHNPQSGRPVHKFVSRQVDHARQLIQTTFIYDELDVEGQVCRTAMTFPLRYLYRSEAEQMLRAAGFFIQGVYGGYDLEPYEDESERMLFLAVRREP
ncbi:MAG: class I SAM-dependent methyltransferase [Chloroflexia bacterium]|nr:class I SAM-dependent methyltransferase [Chloroflexia bacterium]